MLHLRFPTKNNQFIFFIKIFESTRHQVEHVLVVEEADEVEGAEGGGGAEGEVADHHGTGRFNQTRIHIPTKCIF